MESAYIPPGLNHAVKENNMILDKFNLEVTAVSGRDGFGTSKDSFECDVNSSAVMEYNTAQLRGTLSLQGDYTGPVKFCSSAYSLLESGRSEYNAQPLVDLTRDAGFVVAGMRSIKEGDDEKRIQDLISLADVEMTVGNTYDFCIDFKKLGSELDYFIPTGSVASLKFKIRLQTELQKLFYGPVDGTKTISGYTINNLRLTADFCNFAAQPYKDLIKKMESPTGLKMMCHTYRAQTQSLITGALTHKLQGSFQNRNLVSTYFIPINTTVAKNAAGISTTDSIALQTFVGKEYPKNLRVTMGNNHYVNQNSFAGCSGKMEHFMGVYKACRTTSSDHAVASDLANKYLTNDLQITGASFVRGNDNLVRVYNSGANGYINRGLLETSFDTDGAQNGKSILTIGVVTSTVTVQNGQISIVK